MSGRLPAQTRERAQLLLVGAVAVALIILGLVVVYNTILFTQTQEPTQSLADTADADRLRAQLVNDTQELVWAVDNETTGSFCTSGAPAVTNQLPQVSRGLTYTNANSGVKYVSIDSVTFINCGGGVLEINYDLVVQTPETQYRITINAEYNY